VLEVPLSKGSIGEGVSFPSTENGIRSSFRNAVFPRIPDDEQIP
jgi:hypothetical protein